MTENFSDEINKMSIKEINLFVRQLKQQIKFLNKTWKTKDNRKCEIYNCPNLGKNVGKNKDESIKRARKCSKHELEANNIRQWFKNKNKRESFINQILSA